MAFNMENIIDKLELYFIQVTKENEIVIIGGGYLFRDTIKTVNKLLITRVDCDIEGDIYYPDLDLTEWKLQSKESFRKDEDNDYNFEIEEYSKL